MNASDSLAYHQTLTTWSRRKEALADLLDIFGQNMNLERAAQLLQMFATRDFSELPPVVTLPADRMPGLWGGYSREKNRIYLSPDCPADHVVEVLLEETGHFLDRELCVVETTGEEGALFAAVVLGMSPTADQLATWSADEGWAWIHDEFGRVLVEGAKKKKNKGSGSGASSDKTGKKNKRKSGVSGGGRKKTRFTSENDSGGGASASSPGGGGSAIPLPPPPVVPPIDDWEDKRIAQTFVGETLIGNAGNNTFEVIDQDVTIIDTMGGEATIESTAPAFSLKNFPDIGMLSLIGSGNQSAVGNNFANTLVGNAEDNLLNGEDGKDSLIGGAGNDSLQGGTGADTMVGGSGDDTIFIDDAGDVVNEAAGGGADLIMAYVEGLTLAANVENLLLDGSIVSGMGNSLANSLTGNAAANALDGGAGIDTLIGGLGNDTYFLDNSGDVVVEEGGAGTDLVISSVNRTLTEHVENLELIGEAEIGTGNALANRITGNSLANRLDGGDGSDSIIGGAGNDSIIGAQDDGLLDGGADINTLVVGANFNDTGDAQIVNIQKVVVAATGLILNLGDQREGFEVTGFTGGATTFHGGSGADTFVGGIMADSITGGAGVDSLLGGSGDDTIVGAHDDVLIDGGAHKAGDWLQVGANFDDASDAQIENIEKVAVTATGLTVNLEDQSEGFDVMGFAGGATTFVGGSEADTFVGGSGADSIVGGAGADSMVGGTGNDTYVVDRAGDVVEEGANEGTDLVASSVDWTLSANFENLELNGTAVSGTGNALANMITGNAIGNSLDGGAGADTLVGGAGNDTYFVDDAGDKVIEAANAGTDLVVASVSYTLDANVEHLQLIGTAVSGTGNSLNNSITGNDGNNALAGLGGNDTLVGGGGSDSLDGGSDIDSMVGGAGNDTYFVDSVGDVVVEASGQGTDLVVSTVNHTLAANVENLEFSGTENLSGTGNAENNLLAGNSGNNLLTGAGGNDTFVGGEGSDTFIGGTGADSMLGGAGADIMEGRGGADTILGGAGNDTIVVDPAIGVTVDGGADDDTLRFVSNSGMTLGDSDFGRYSNIESYDFSAVVGDVDITIGNNAQSQGIATLTGGTANSSLTANEDYTGNVHFTGGAGTNSLTGNTGDDTLLGADGNDTFVGGSGDDSLDGGAGNDSMVGGAGNDTYVVDSATDAVVEHAGEGTDLVRSSVSYSLGSNVEGLVLTGSSIIHGTGNELDNALTGNSLGNSLDGGIGNDTMIGGLGNDTYFVDEATEVVTELLGEGTDLVVASVTGYTLAENVENLLLGTGVVSGIGNSLGNTITGNISSNSLNGGAGLDTMIGGQGNDTYFVDNTSDVVTEISGEGTDLVVASVSGYTLANHVENLALAGTALAATGNSLNNTITGNSVGNSLNGGSGVDTLIGGVGNDTYIVDSATDTIVEDGGDAADLVVSSVYFNLSNALVGGGNTVENLQLTGTAVSGTGNALNNSLTGNSVGNSLDGGVGIDTMIGGQGNDTYFVDNATEVVTELSGEGTDLVVASVTGYTLADNVENLQLTGTAVRGTGNSLANTLTGNATGNSLDGGTGIDSLIGGAGNDSYFVDNAGDAVFENTGAGEDLVESSVSYTLADNIEKLTLTGTAVSATGNSLANTLTGNSVGNSLDGGAEIDSLIGGAGSDTYFVDNAGDMVFENASEGTDVVVASASGYTLAANVENLELSGTEDLTGTGNAENNLLTGNSGNNLLTGAGGNDTFVGGEGDDTFVGGTGDDSMVGGAGDDSMVGGGEADTILGGVGNDTIVVDPAIGVTVDGGADDDTLRFVSNSGMTLGDSDFGRYSNIESYDFSGVIGDVDITIGSNAQALGIATLAGGTANSALTANADYTGSVHFTGGAGTNSLTGNIGNDTLLGAGGNDTVVGGAGNDSIDGGAGDDSMVGGAGNDTYVVDSATDAVVEHAGEGVDLVRSAIDYTLDSNFEALELTGTDNINGTGNAADNTITGNSGNNLLAGAGGNDTLLGGKGHDSLDGGTGDDSMVGGAGNDTYVVDSASDALVENANEGTDLVRSVIDYTLGSNFENLELTGPSNINGTGNELANSIVGNSGNNTLAGGDGNDTISGGGGDDSLYGGAGADSLVGGTGNDTLKAGEGNDYMDGGDNDDSFLFPSAEQIVANTVVGGAGTDTLILSAATSITDAQLVRVSQVEVLQASSLAGNSIALGVNAQSSGVESLFGGVASDSLSAAGMSSGNIWIQGSLEASTVGDTLVAGTGTSRATLVGNDHADADNYFQISAASLLGNNSIVGGANSEDYLQITGSNQTLADASFTQVSDLDRLILTGGSNSITLGVIAQAKFGDSISLTGGANGGDTINLSATTKKVYLDASDSRSGDTITAGSNDNTLIGGAGASANDLFIFTSGSHLNGASIVGGGGTDTLRLSANGQMVVSADLDKLSSIEVFDLAGAVNNITLGAISAGIATIVGGTGPNTFNAAGYNSAPNALTWNMNASNGSDSLLGGANGNLFQIRNGANLQNSVITGNTGRDTIQLLAGAQTLGDAAFSNISGNSIESLVLGSATNGNSLTLGTTAASKGIATVVGGTSKDTINASAFGKEIWIDASAGTGARLTGSTTALQGNTLIGGSAGGNEFIVGDLGANSVVGGSNGLDTLTFSSATTINDGATANGQIHDDDDSTASVSKVGTLKFNAAGNNIMLGADALIAGIRTLVGGEGNDLGTGNTINTSAYGSAGVLFQVSDQNYLSNITAMVGGSGVDTLKFSRDGVSVTDENVVKLSNIDVLQTANGNNRFLISNIFGTGEKYTDTNSDGQWNLGEALADINGNGVWDGAGIDSIIGGTGRDTIDMASNVLYTPASNDDITTIDLSAGAGYTLISTTDNFEFAKVIGSATTAGSVILDVTDVNDANLYDADFANMYQGNIGTVFMRTGSDNTVVLGENALASGLDMLTMSIGNDDVDVSDFLGALAVNGGDGDDIVSTSFAALANLTFTGGDGADTLQLEGSDARAITSLVGTFDALALNDGNNFVILANDAGLSSIHGGGGSDTISMLNNTTGINFVMRSGALSSAATAASLDGGSGSDTLTLADAPGTFNDTQFSRLGSVNWAEDLGAIENFVTFFNPAAVHSQAGNGGPGSGAGGGVYNLGGWAELAGVKAVHFFDQDNIDAFFFNQNPLEADRGLQFIYQSDWDLAGSRIVGTSENDTLTLAPTQDADNPPPAQVVLDTDFVNIQSMEIFTFVAEELDTAVSITLDATAEATGISRVITSGGDDEVDATNYTANLTLTGGAGNDTFTGGAGRDVLTGSSAVACGANEVDQLTGGGGADLFVLGDATNAYYITAERGGDAVVIFDFNSADGDAIQLRDLSAAYGLAENLAVPGSPSNNYGYVIGATDLYQTGAAVNSFLYVDNDKSGTISTGDNLVAAIQDDVGGGLTKGDLLTDKFIIV